MPDSTIPAPVAADPIDRLTLGATDARESAAGGPLVVPAGICGAIPPPYCLCMSEE
jgi:hypothetical protein